MLKIFSDLLVCIAVVSALAIVDLETLGVLIFLFLTMFILFNKFLYSKVERYGEEFRLADRLMIKGISEGVSGMKEIRILGKEDFFKKTVSRGIRKMAEMDVKQTLIHNSPKSFLELVMVVFVVIIVFMNFYIQNNLDTVVTVLGVFAVGAVRLVPIVSGLFGAIATIKYGRSSVSNLIKDIQSFETEGSEAIERKGTTPQQQNFLDLDISSISYSYPNSGEKALEDISLKIKKGDFVGLVGPSGAGKTTLVDVLLGLLHPQTGTIKLNGKDIFSQIELWRSLVAYLPQEIFLIDDSLAKNIALDDDIENLSHDRFKEVVIKSRLDDFIDNLPEGLDTRMGERGVRLSGGQRQRVAIARALFHEREVLILDEATSSLDMKTEEEIVNQ
jgi:ABC-type bacteriocin/lantibiotic exporter with double-glycine peptidase domain